MKTLNDYTDQEKIQKFDEIHKSCLEEFNESATHEDRDEHYFWEDVMVKVLGLTDEDWTKHNRGQMLGVSKPVYKKEKVTIDVPYCPQCKSQLEEVTDLDARTIMTYKCNHCNYRY